jgi:hypothetical protein
MHYADRNNYDASKSHDTLPLETPDRATSTPTRPVEQHIADLRKPWRAFAQLLALHLDHMVISNVVALRDCRAE